MAARTKLRFEKKATALGTYWTSPNTKAELRKYLLSDTEPLYKTSSLGGEPENGFENSFASLAYAYIKDSAPRLLDFIVGFQLIDRNEDNTKAVGVFGFKVGDQWLYAPVFFLNGDLKGHELLYLKNRDMFVPLAEEWVNRVISQRPHSLGEGSALTPHQLGGMTPNLNRLARPPMGGMKYGSDMAPWALAALPVVCAAAVKSASALYRGQAHGELNFDEVVAAPSQAALAASPVDLSDMLLEPRFYKLAQQMAAAYPAIKKGFERFYGADFFAKTAARSKANSKCLLGSTKLAAAQPNSISRNKIEKAAEIEIIALTVSDEAPITVNNGPLTDAEREKLLHDMVLIRDKRDPHSERNSIAYNTQVNLNLSNPSETGLFEVLEKPGTFDPMVVLYNPMSGRGRRDFCTVIRKSGERNWRNIHPTRIFVQVEGHPGGEAWRKYVDGLGDANSLREEGLYLAIGVSGESTCPFRITRKLGEDRYQVDWSDYNSLGREHYLPPLTRDWTLYGPRDYSDVIVINNRDGTKLRLINGELRIPKEFKILKLEDPPKKDHAGCLCSLCTGESSGADAPIEPGSLIDVQLLLHKEASVLQIHDQGGQDVWLKSGTETSVRMAKKAALVSLVRDHGLREPQARLMLKEACQRGLKKQAAVYLVKYADGYNYNQLQPGPDSPPFPEPYYGSEPMGRDRSVSAIYPQEETVPVDSMSSQLTDPSLYDPYYEPDDQAMQVAQQAAGAGQKEVFDTSVMSGMLKSLSGDSLVDKHLGKLMSAVDALGRILFMFYWHQEEFEDRYGKQDLPELEDGLRNAFEANGKISLFLQEKTVKGSMRGGASVGNPEDIEPGLYEVARN